MKRAASFIVASALLSSVVTGCDSAPGRPRSGSEVPRPSQVLDFDALYGQNCAGCHGSQGSGGAAIALNSPVYLAMADDATLRRVTAQGVSRTAMPAFAQSAGGMLTDQQVNVIVFGIRSRWGKRALGATPPSYEPATAGDTQNGLKVYETYCSSCHGKNGRGGTQAGSIVDESFLSLISDQYLRTIVVTGRPELGGPDWRGNVPGQPMSQQQVSDVVAWLSAQRRRLTLSASAKSPSGGIQ